MLWVRYSLGPLLVNIRVGSSSFFYYYRKSTQLSWAIKKSAFPQLNFQYILIGITSLDPNWRSSNLRCSNLTRSSSQSQKISLLSLSLTRSWCHVITTLIWPNLLTFIPTLLPRAFWKNRRAALFSVANCIDPWMNLHERNYERFVKLSLSLFYFRHLIRFLVGNTALFSNDDIFMAPKSLFSTKMCRRQFQSGQKINFA